MSKVNMKEWDIPVFIVNMLLLEQVIWRDTSKRNMKEWDIPVFIVNMLQLDASDLKRHDESKHEGGRYPCKVKVWDSGESNKGQVRWSPPINLLRFTLVMNVNIMQL